MKGEDLLWMMAVIVLAAVVIFAYWAFSTLGDEVPADRSPHVSAGQRMEPSR